MHVSFFISCTASLLSLSALALDRYVAITYPLFYRSKLNAKRSLLVSAGVWTVSVLLSTISFASRLREISVRLLQHRSRRDIRGVNFHNSKKFSSSCELKTDNIGTTFIIEPKKTWRKSKRSNGRKRSLKHLLLSWLLFLACYLPSCICIYIINYCANCNKLCVYSLGERHSECSDVNKFWSKSICVCMEVR